MITIRDGEVSSAVVALIREAMEIRMIGPFQLSVLMDVSPPRITQLLEVDGPYRSQGNMLHKIITALELEMDIQIVDPRFGANNPEGHGWWNRTKWNSEDLPEIKEIQEATNWPDLTATSRALRGYDRALAAEKALRPRTTPEEVQRVREATDRAAAIVGEAFKEATDPTTADRVTPSQWIRDLIQVWENSSG